MSMANMSRPCPNCRYPLALPQPIPERFQCPKCGTVLQRKGKEGDGGKKGDGEKVTVGAPSPALPFSPSPARPVGFTPKKQMLLLGGFITFLLGSIAIILIVLLNTNSDDRSGGDKTGDGNAEVAGTDGGNKKDNPSNSAESSKPSNPSDSGTTTPQKPKEDLRPKIVKPHIDKGVAYLLKEVKEKREVDKVDPIRFWGDDWERGTVAQGPWATLALVGLTLLECGVPADDENIVWLADKIEKEKDKLKYTHSAAAVVMFVCRWHDAKEKAGGALDPRFRQLLRTLTLRLVAGQLDYGAWAEDLPMLDPGKENQLEKELKANKFKPGKEGAGTSANTFFALQALWGARKQAIPIRESFIVAGGHFQRTQRPDGSWAPAEAIKDRFLATATCDGLIAVAMEKAILEMRPRPFVPGEKTADPARALAFLAKSLGDNGERADHEDKGKLFGADAKGDIYFLWCVAQIGITYDKELIAGKDWYEWGYKILLKSQEDDGSWQRDTLGPLVDTCYAVLFLKKSNLTSDLTAKLKEVG
jgi:hypothetical protein